MQISSLIDILTQIRNNCGDINIQIFYDTRQSENVYSDSKELLIDDVKMVKINNDCTQVYLSNEYGANSEYLGYTCEYRYDPDSKMYYGVINMEPEVPFNTVFYSKEKYSLENLFHVNIDEYINKVNIKNLNKTYNTINDILDKYEESDDDSEYE